MPNLARFLNPFDGRYEDLRAGGRPGLNVLRDLCAGLIVSLVAIPLAVGFAMASGLRPEQGILGGAIACLIGALWGGSKYQIAGPTAAFIPALAAVMAKYDHGFLIAASLAAGLVLAVMGMARLGRLVASVSHPIIVGFTMGIAAIIALSQVGEALGLQATLGSGFVDKLRGIAEHFGELNPYAIAIAAGTFLATKLLLRISLFIPAPLIAVGASTALASTVWSGKGLITLGDRYGTIPFDALNVTLPKLPELTPTVLLDLGYFAVTIVFVAAVESLLCARMADRLAGNKGQPYDPDRELFGQGLMNVAVPLLNGFPSTGALARTATNIKLGAVSPLAAIFKSVCMLALAAFLASALERVPMACIGGILLYVASNMVKAEEVREVFAGRKRADVALMFYTAVMVLFTDFLTGVLSAVALGFVVARAEKSLGRRSASAGSA